MKPNRWLLVGSVVGVVPSCVAWALFRTAPFGEPGYIRSVSWWVLDAPFCYLASSLGARWVDVVDWFVGVPFNGVLLGTCNYLIARAFLLFSHRHRVQPRAP